jgi:hypothetical protein
MKEALESRVSEGRRVGRRGRRRTPGATGRSPRPAAPYRAELERLIREHALSISLVGLALGVLVNRKFLAVPLALTPAVLEDLLAESPSRPRRRTEPQTA